MYSSVWVHDMCFGKRESVSLQEQVSMGKNLTQFCLGQPHGEMKNQN